jgi:hypothetical protein
MAVAGAAAGVVVLAAAAPGQVGTGGTITHNDAVFRMADSPTVNTGVGTASMDFRVTGPAGTDHGYQHWWWVRVNGVDTREYCLANATSPSWSGSQGSMAFTNATYSALVVYTVTGGPPGSGRGQVTARLTLTNNTQAPLSLAVFSYLDYDLNATAGSDSATLLSSNRIGISEGSTTAEFYGPGAAAYQVTAFATLRGLLTNTTVDNLANTGLPFGPGDWTGGFQYNLTLPANGSSATVTSVFSINQPATVPCPVDYDNNGQVEPADISLFVNTWLSDLTNGTTVADFDGNGLVQPADVSLFVASWFSALSTGSC